ncbi:MAG TPA: BACON domain-containing carbohydrate-binding protein, partial [Prolixibacteraceae bacterium]|nr:BACON domain-containing carbohydrate-binding protein [Prolixibacteraceae bacterium]
WKANSTSSVAVASNTTWMVSSDQSWLSVSPAEGANNGKITLTATENSTYSSRTAIVTVVGEGARSQTIIVTQEAAILTVSFRTVSLKKDANSYAVVNVTSNTTWNIGSDQTWLTITPTSGADNGMITLTATANTTSESRTATVTVSGVNVISQTITVTQAAGTNGVDVVREDEIRLYPNPVTDHFRIDGIAGKATIIISDLNGKIRLAREISGDETIPAGSLAKGVYWLMVRTDNRIIERKLMKE